MPFKSQAQNRAFRAAAADPQVAEHLGIPQKTAKKFIADSAGQKVGSLPEYAPKKHARGGYTCPPRKSVW